MIYTCVLLFLADGGEFFYFLFVADFVDTNDDDDVAVAVAAAGVVIDDAEYAEDAEYVAVAADCRPHRRRRQICHRPRS